MNKERIDRLVEQKKEKLPDGVSILGPTEVAAVEQTDWLIKLLGSVYVQHGITKKWEELWLDIVEGKCRPWFAVRDGKPIASAALIRQDDGAVEIGRAVSLENGVGGLLMLLAVADHLSHSGTPVTAEVRVTDQFMGVPSGEATQTICFRHLGLTPQALVPAFNHGEPNRQEMFLFSSSEKIATGAPLILPDNLAFDRLIRKTALAIAAEGFCQSPEILSAKERRSSSKWSVVFQEPFNLVAPEKGGMGLATVINAVEKRSPFTLIPLSMDGVHLTDLAECLNLGFVPCGFDRNPDRNGHPVLLLGKLRQETLLAPIKVVSGLFDARTISGIRQIDVSFREGVN